MTGRHSLIGLGTRLGAGIAVLVVAYCATIDTWVRIARKDNPDAVLRVRPTDAVALAKVFDNRLIDDPAAPVPDTMEVRARTALNEQPLNPEALRLIGLWAASRHSPALSDRAMKLSARVTRRKAFVQFWLIERAVQRGDVPGAIAHYHAALSVAPSTRSVLFPILTTSLSNADIRAAVRPYIRQGTTWSADLLNAAITQGDPRDVAALMLPIAASLRTEPWRFTNAMLISRLTETGSAPLARLFVARVWPETRAQGLSDFGVTSATTDPRLGSLGWTLSTDGSVRASTDDNGGLNLEVDARTNDRAARRIWPVTGGRTYRFTQTVTPSSADLSLIAPRSIVMHWMAYCPMRGRRPVIWDLTARPGMPGPKASLIQVPGNCAALEFTLTVANSDEQNAAHIKLGSLELVEV